MAAASSTASKATAKKAARSAAQKSAATRKARSKAAGEKIEVELSNPLNDGNPFTGEAQEVGDEISVTRAQARHLLAAGYLKGDPEDPEDVARVLQLSGPEAEDETEKQGGQGAPAGT